MFRLYRTKFPSLKPLIPLLSPIVLLAPRRPIYNDYQVKSTPSLKPNTMSISTPGTRKKMYNELTIGSVTGLFLGVIIGKFSSLIVSLTLSVYLLVQFLKSRNLITIPWTYAFKLNGENFDLRDLVFENFNFKLSFVLSFLIACFNV